MTSFLVALLVVFAALGFGLALGMLLSWLVNGRG